MRCVRCANDVSSNVESRPVAFCGAYLIIVTVGLRRRPASGLNARMASVACLNSLRRDGVCAGDRSGFAVVTKPVGGKFQTAPDPLRNEHKVYRAAELVGDQVANYGRPIARPDKHPWVAKLLGRMLALRASSIISEVAPIEGSRQCSIASAGREMSRQGLDIVQTTLMTQSGPGLAFEFAMQYPNEIRVEN
jgi:hypothetical protein